MKTSGFDHINLTVSNLARSRRFYGDLLGFELHITPDDYPDSLAAGSFSFFVGSVEVAVITHPTTSPEDRFDETRIGLDHLSFKAPNEQALYDLAGILQEAGVETNGVEEYTPNGKKYVAFRDPDNIQLEYWLDSRE